MGRQMTEERLKATPLTPATPERDKRRKKKKDKKEKNNIGSSPISPDNLVEVEQDRLVKLNVGGTRYITRYSTLTRNGMQENFFIPLLSGKFPVERDEKGYIFLDRNGTYFEFVLD